jgi:hypothetical protein
MKGIIYCFNTLTASNIYKAGRTQTELKRRLRGYLGPSKPLQIVFSKEVDDDVRAEQMLLMLMRNYTGLRARTDYGNEWFEATVDRSMEERHEYLQSVAMIVQMAVRQPGRSPAMAVDEVPGLVPMMMPSAELTSPVPPTVPPTVAADELVVPVEGGSVYDRLAKFAYAGGR